MRIQKYSVADLDPRLLGKPGLGLDPHQRKKPDPHQTEKSDRDPHYSEQPQVQLGGVEAFIAMTVYTGAVNAHNGAMKAYNGAMKAHPGAAENPKPDPHQSE
jgi:hypothetical protein